MARAPRPQPPAPCDAPDASGLGRPWTLHRRGTQAQTVHHEKGGVRGGGALPISSREHIEKKKGPRWGLEGPRWGLVAPNRPYEIQKTPPNLFLIIGPYQLGLRDRATRQPPAYAPWMLRLAGPDPGGVGHPTFCTDSRNNKGVVGQRGTISGAGGLGSLIRKHFGEFSVFRRSVRNYYGQSWDF